MRDRTSMSARISALPTKVRTVTSVVELGDPGKEAKARRPVATELNDTLFRLVIPSVVVQSYTGCTENCLNYAHAETVAIIYIDNGLGMSRHAELLGQQLERLGRTVRRIPLKTARQSGKKPSAPADLAIHLEKPYIAQLNQAREHVIIPNLEWLKPDLFWFKKEFAAAWTKTPDAQAFMSKVIPSIEVGNESDDIFAPEIRKDWNQFFHLAGGSPLKGTEALVSAWRNHPEWPELIIKCRDHNAPTDPPSNVRLINEYLPQDELWALQNRCGMHLCPSRSEGWGHHITEGMSAANLVLTTDAAPMNHLIRSDCGILVPASDSGKLQYGRKWDVVPQELERAIERMIVMPEEEKARIGAWAREKFLELVSFHRSALAGLFAAEG